MNYSDKVKQIVDSKMNALRRGFEGLDRSDAYAIDVWEIFKDAVEPFCEVTGLTKSEAWNLYFKKELKKRFPHRGCV